MSPLAMMTHWSVVSDQWSPILNPPLVARNTLLISDDKSSTGHATRTGRCRCSSSFSPSLLSWLKDNWGKNQVKCLQKTTGGQFSAKKHRDICETALILGIPSISGIQDIPSIPSIPGLLEIVKFG